MSQWEPTGDINDATGELVIGARAHIDLWGLIMMATTWEVDRRVDKVRIYRLTGHLMDPGKEVLCVFVLSMFTLPPWDFKFPWDGFDLWFDGQYDYY